MNSAANRYEFLHPSDEVGQRSVVIDAVVPRAAGPDCVARAAWRAGGEEVLFDDLHLVLDVLKPGTEVVMSPGSRTSPPCKARESRSMANTRYAGAATASAAPWIGPRFLTAGPLVFITEHHRQMGVMEMRKLIEATLVSLDGVVGSPQEWALPRWDEENKAYAQAALADVGATRTTT
jgi:hypothetical protein